MTAPAPKLLGTYQAPPFAYGQTVRCEVRGEVEVVGLSARPTTWPVGRPADGPRRKLPVVLAGLAEALRRESTLAVAHWWGVGENSVWRWRKALGLTGVVTEGTRLLRETAQSPGARTALARAQARGGVAVGRRPRCARRPRWAVARGAGRPAGSGREAKAPRRCGAWAGGKCLRQGAAWGSIGRRVGGLD